MFDSCVCLLRVYVCVICGCRCCCALLLSCVVFVFCCYGCVVRSALVRWFCCCVFVLCVCLGVLLLCFVLCLS